MVPKIRIVFLFKRHILQFFAHFLWSPRNSGQVIPTPSSTHDPLLQGVVFAMGYTVNLTTSESTEESAGSGYRDDFHEAKLENPVEYGIPYGFLWFNMVLYGFIRFHGIWNMESSTGCGPPSDVCWFISHNKTTVNYSYIYHRPYLNHL